MKRPARYSLSVSDNGPGLPIGFNPACSKGLGMKIVLSLVKQIGGELHILPGDNGGGARVAVVSAGSYARRRSGQFAGRASEQGCQPK
jgi:two-component sensor histidine kinase